MVAGLTLCGRVRPLTIEEGLGVELLLFGIKIEVVQEVPWSAPTVVEVREAHPNGWTNRTLYT